MARQHAESEFEKFRVIKGRLQMSDWDREVERLLVKKD
jgi:hypothetical protein